MRKRIFKVDDQVDSFSEGFRKRIGIKWAVGNIEEELVKSHVFYSMNMVRLLHSLSNRQARLFIAIYALTRNGTCGIVIKSRILSTMSFVDKSHYWTYLNQLKRMRFIGLTKERVVVTIYTDEGVEERMKGRIIWIEGRGKIGKDSTSFEDEARDEAERYTKEVIKERCSEVPSEIKTIIAYR